jgi:hypothetical protein
MSDSESDDENMSLPNLDIEGARKPVSNFLPTENSGRTKDSKVKASQESCDGWKEPVQRFRDGELELLTATLDSDDLRKLGVPPGVNSVKVQIVGGVLLINAA